MAGLDMIKWLGHASFRIDASQTVYIDPYKIHEGKSADIIFITHSHYDHCSEDDVNKIKKKDTILVAPSDCIPNWEGERMTMAPCQTKVIKGIPVSTVPAYNINKKFHPKQNNWVGYILDINGLTIYHAGDTDATPEMEALDVDIALLPIGGTYTMDVKEALSVLNKIKVKTVVPMHYEAIVGTRKDAIELKMKSRAGVVILKTD